MTDVDDELISAYIDRELGPAEQQAVEGLIASDEAWSKRYESFVADSEHLKALPQTKLTEEQRDMAIQVARGDIAFGVGRRRVPRYRRRWMFGAAILVPCLLTLLYFQNPTHQSRLYLKADRVTLEAGRSVEESSFVQRKVWSSPRIWAKYHPGPDTELGFQLDSKNGLAQSVFTQIKYDFDGDGTFEREEAFEAVTLDLNRGWERFTPRMLRHSGSYEDFRGGRVEITFESRDIRELPILLSGTPGEIVLPYRGLRGVAADD